MSKKPTTIQKLQYRLDSYFSAGTPLLLLSIVIATSLVVVGIGVTLYLLGLGSVSGGDSFIEHIWDALGKTIDPGYAQEKTWPHRIVMLLATIFGILIVSTLIGVLTTGIEHKLNSLRRGKSLVLETGHVIVIGWSSKIFSVLEQLHYANEKKKGKKGGICVVVLADMDKVKMEHEIKVHPSLRKLKSRRLLKTVCRCGKANDEADLAMVNPKYAKSIIIISEGKDDTDAVNFKTCLALKKVMEGRLTKRVVVEMSDQMNIDAIRHIDKNIFVVNPGELISKILVQSTREPGLSDVYDEILSFDGEEIYFMQPEDAVGHSVLDVIYGLQEETFIGIHKKNGDPSLNPYNDYDSIIKNDDKIITIAKDDNTLKFKAIESPKKITRALPVQKNEPEAILILGWNLYGGVFLKELQELIHENSTVTIAFDDRLTNSKIPECDLKVEEIPGRSTKDRTFLDSLNISTKFDHVVVFSYSDKLSNEDADSSSLLTLVHLRDIVENETSQVNIASEILGVHNRDLLKQRNNDDFIASEELVSKYLVQLAEDEEKIEQVLTNLLTATGQEFHMRPAGNYCNTNTKVSFLDIVVAGIEFNELVVGYTKDGNCQLNPKKSTEISFKDSDSIIVLSEK